MGLPRQHIDFPPRELTPAFNQIEHDAAVLRGDVKKISEYLEQPQPQGYRTRAQYSGGLVGGVARGLLGTPQQDKGQPISHHLPLASTLCATSAAILVGSPPVVTLHVDDNENQQAQECLSTVTTTDAFAETLQQAAYTCAGLGWVIGRVVWDNQVSEHPWLQWVDPDQAIVNFLYGEVESVVFWDKLPNLPDTKATYRLVQSHSSGRIDYGLYAGSDSNLGQLVPLSEHPDTTYLVDIVDENSGVDTGTGLITAMPIMNTKDAMRWRHDPQLKSLGNSDVAKGGDIWQNIDRLYSQLMQEFEMGKSKLLVSEELLTPQAPGSGLSFDLNRGVYAVAQGANADQPPTIEQVQFDIRVSQYLQALNALQREAVAAVGLSAITTGMGEDAAMTATEIRARSQKTLETWKVKSRFWRAGLSHLITALLQVDAHVNGYTPISRLVDVSLHEPVVETELDKARTLGELRAAGVASTGYCVRRLHPEWTPEQVVEEVTAIRGESLAADPFMLGADEYPPSGEQ